jgi:fumarate reductase flavoprotein subunit
LFAIGECASVGLHGANRLGSNSLSELLVFGKIAGKRAAALALKNDHVSHPAIAQQTAVQQALLSALPGHYTNDSLVAIRTAMTKAMEEGCGIYRDADSMQYCLDQFLSLKQRYQVLKVEYQDKVYNSSLLQDLELGFGLDVAMAICSSALARKESRGAHQHLDEGLTTRNDAEFSQHSLAEQQQDGSIDIRWQAVTITSLPPGQRLYGDCGAVNEGKTS